MCVRVSGDDLIIVHLVRVWGGFVKSESALGFLILVGDSFRLESDRRHVIKATSTENALSRSL